MESRRWGRAIGPFRPAFSEPQVCMQSQTRVFAVKWGFKGLHREGSPQIESSEDAEGKGGPIFLANRQGDSRPA